MEPVIQEKIISNGKNKPKPVDVSLNSTDKKTAVVSNIKEEIKIITGTAVNNDQIFSNRISKPLLDNNVRIVNTKSDLNLKLNKNKILKFYTYNDNSKSKTINTSA